MADRLHQPDPYRMAREMPSRVFEEWKSYHRAKAIESKKAADRARSKKG